MLTILLQLAVKRANNDPPRGGDTCCITLTTASMVSTFSEWACYVVMDSMVFLLLKLEYLLFLSEILFGFISTVVLVNWDSLFRFSGNYYLYGSEISMPLSFLPWSVFLFLWFIPDAEMRLYPFRPTLKCPFFLNRYNYGYFSGKIRATSLVKYVQAPEISSF